MSPDRINASFRRGLATGAATVVTAGILAFGGWHLTGALFDNDRDEVTVAGHVIDEDTVDQFVDQAMAMMPPPESGASHGPDAERSFREVAWNHMVLLSLLRADAQARNITISDSDIQRMLAQTPDRDPETEPQAYELANAEYAALTMKLRDAVSADSEVDLSEGALRKWYAQNANEFRTAPRRAVFIIGTRSAADARAAKRLAERGAPMDKAYERFADKRAPLNAGRRVIDLQAGALPKAVSDAVYSADDKTWVGPHKVGDHWYTFFTAGQYHPEVQQSFSAARTQVYAAMLNQHQNELWTTYLAELRRKSAGDIHDPAGLLPPLPAPASTPSTPNVPRPPQSAP